MHMYIYVFKLWVLKHYIPLFNGDQNLGILEVATHPHLELWPPLAPE